MKDSIKILFPYKLHLTILQLEGYDLKRFLNWILSNLITRRLEGKKSLVWTTKAKILTAYTLFFVLVMGVLLFNLFGFLGLFVFVALNTQPWLFISLAILANMPKEYMTKILIKRQMKGKILKLKSDGLKVVGITGSYGKTSTKETLYHILKQKYRVLRTPESYNTLFGIKKVLDYELYENYDFFIVEMGAYKRGEIKELCEVLLPDYAILTGINEQHLERFGIIENTIKAKFELIESLPKKENAVLNIDSQHINNNYHKYTANPVLYGLASEKYTILKPEFGGDGSRFDLILNGKAISTETPIIGFANIQNILASSAMAFVLDMTLEELAKAIRTLKTVEHRQQIKKLRNGNLLIDDSYSSNVTGFEEALKTLKLYPKYRKIVVTPGIVELGKETENVHIRLGKKIAQIADEVFLIGKNERTEAIAEGVEHRVDVIYLNKTKDLFLKLENKEITNTVVLLENDLPDNY